MVFVWLFGLNRIGLQGTKISEDREILHKYHITSEGSPPQRGSARIIKYTGALASPEWKDFEPGRAFSFPLYLVKTLRAKRQVRGAMSCRGRHLQRSIYVKTRGNRKNCL